MSVRKLNDGKPKLWLVEVYPQGRGGARKRKRFATKGEALAWEKHMLAQPWQQPEAGNGDERRLSDLVALWYGRHGQTLTDGDRRRDKLSWHLKLVRPQAVLQQRATSSSQLSPAVPICARRSVPLSHQQGWPASSFQEMNV